MSGRKQKSPDAGRGETRRAEAGRAQARRSGKGRSVKEPGLASRLLLAAGGAAARHPKPLFGFAAFAVLFSFVAANALWYQPGGHPSPFLATRDPEDPNRIAGYRPLKRTAPADVTTFRIERAPEPPAPALAQPSPSADNAPALPQPAEPDRQLVADIQDRLAQRGLYDGVQDGVIGSKTEAAILLFQETAGLPKTGEATPDLLGALKSEPRPASAPPAHDLTAPPQVAAPLPRPAPPETARSQPQKPVQQQPHQAQRNPPAPGQPASVQSASVQPAKGPAVNRPAETISMRAEDPIAAAIRSAERNPAMTPPADIPNAGWKNTTTAANTKTNAGVSAARLQAPVPASDMVLQIQKGLANIAYTDVEVDGVAGSQTKAAIRRFEKHYRLPETGEPNDMVLKKLKAIGAL
jgi:peptidoglycan hydrolase-like protein with peptidoglycan-binding domain